MGGYISSFKSTCKFYDPISAILVDSCGSGVSLSWNLDTGRIRAVFNFIVNCPGVEGDIEFIQHLHIWIFLHMKLDGSYHNLFLSVAS